MLVLVAFRLPRIALGGAGLLTRTTASVVVVLLVQGRIAGVTRLSLL